MTAETCIHFTPGPTVEIKREVDDRETRWCFACRARLPHEWVLYDDPPERQPSYYDPLWVLECSRCHRDRTRFGDGAR